MAIATGCVVAGALLTSPAGRSVMSSAASNTTQHILAMMLGTSNGKDKNMFLSSRIQAKLECILHLFRTMQRVEEKKAAEAEGVETSNKEEFKKEKEVSYEKTMWNRVFREMASIQSLVCKMNKEQEEDQKSWTRCYWPRSQTSRQMAIIGHLETIEEIIRFVTMVTPYIHQSSGSVF